MALVNPNIAMSYKPTTEYQPRNALADYAQIQQIQSGRQQAEIAGMEIQEYKRKRDRLNKIQAAMVAAGGPADVRAGAMEMMNYPESLAEGKKLLQDVEDKEKLEQYIAEQTGGKPSVANALAPNVPATPMMSGALGSGTFDIVPPPVANALAPAATPVANALAPAATPMDEVTKLEADIVRLSGNTDPRAIAIVNRLEKRLEELTKSEVVAPGGTVYRGGKPIYTAPNQRTSKLLTPEEFEQEAQLRLLGRQPGSTVSINTQLPASEEAQKEFMKEMRQTFGALKQAPTVLENIESAKKLIPQAKGFMGTGGEPLLAAASFLNNRLGTNINTKGVESAEELRSRLFFGILDNLKKLDSQPSQQQQEALRVALGSIGTDPNALPRVLDAFGNSIRQKVDLYNEEAAGAEARGVKFPYKPTIALPSRPSGARPTSGNVVVTPDGRSHSFPTPEAAAQFKKAAGL